jgi:flagellar biosynthesis/type III secretory pathway protein FliH
MSTMIDPYRVLGVSPTATDAELRAAYRRLVQLHHPDHNGGSPESAQRFEEVQEAYAEVRRQRGAGPAAATPPPPASDPDLDARLADMERNLKAARAARDARAQAARRAREQSIRDARAAAESEGRPRPTDEELGYFSTDDSLTKIIDDATAALGHRFSEARESPVGRRVSDLIDELADKLTGQPPKHP